MVQGPYAELDGAPAAVEVRPFGYFVTFILLNPLQQTYPEVQAAAAHSMESEPQWGSGPAVLASASVANIVTTTPRIQPFYDVPKPVLAPSASQISRFIPRFPNPFTTSSRIHSDHDTGNWALRQCALDPRSTNVSTDQERHPIELSFVPKIENDVPERLFPDITVKLVFPPATYNGVFARGVTVNPGKEPTDVFERNISLSTLEDAQPWDGYENDTLPPKNQGRYIRNLRYQIFSLYRRLFGIVFVVNMSILIAILCQGGATAQRLGLIVIANISSSIFMRQDYVINAFFAFFCAVPLSYVVESHNSMSTHVCEQMAPMHSYNMCTCIPYRRTCVNYHLVSPVMSSIDSHYLQVHSGFAISGVMWLVLFAVQATRELLHAGPVSQRFISN